MTQRVLVVGLGNMGMSHALAYARIDGFEVVGVCERKMSERHQISQSAPHSHPQEPKI